MDAKTRARMGYAFRVFAAIYGYRVTEKHDAEIRCYYGKVEREPASPRSVHIPARYRARAKNAELPTLTKLRYAKEDVYLVHGVDEQTGNPDWLGEIFEWISSSLEQAVTARDSVGRIPYSQTVFERQHISAQRPHAAVVMAWLENMLQNGPGTEALPRATSPVPGVEHMVISSHDIDFYFTNRAKAWSRLGKNLGISLLLYRSPSFFASNSRMMLKLLLGEQPGQYIPAMIDAIEESGFRSTLFAVAAGGHRRDPSYDIDQIAPHLRQAAQRGFEIGLHASYASVTDRETLAEEATELERAVEHRPRGSRQHWLRFDERGKLYRAVEDARLAYDSSQGFSETCGFRNGANFAFPPYDFQNERPCSFLEIPLVIMDGSLEASSRKTKTDPQEIADSILAESRKWGWGGISLLWHNPIEAIQVPDKINRVFWDSAKKRNKYAEQWMSAENFLTACAQRYEAAGLLGGSASNA